LDHGMSRHRHFLLKPAGHRRWIQDRCSMFAICATRLHICAESYALRSNASSSGRNSESGFPSYRDAVSTLTTPPPATTCDPGPHRTTAASAIRPAGPRLLRSRSHSAAMTLRSA
jgi:hypothetical protein